MRVRFLSVFFTLLFAFDAMAQTNPTIPPNPKPRPKPNETIHDDMPQEVSLPEEMRIKMAIARADAEHKKVLADVDKLNELSAEVAKEFTDNGKLSSDEVKKLGTIEKLAKRILNHAGGDEVDDHSGKFDQMSAADAVAGINNAAAVIKKTMTTETRHVVSASVISNSNDIINMVQFLRHAQK